MLIQLSPSDFGSLRVSGMGSSSVKKITLRQCTDWSHFIGSRGFHWNIIKEKEAELSREYINIKNVFLAVLSHAYEAPFWKTYTDPLGVSDKGFIFFFLHLFMCIFMDGYVPE